MKPLTVNPAPLRWLCIAVVLACNASGFYWMTGIAQFSYESAAAARSSSPAAIGGGAGRVLER